MINMKILITEPKIFSKALSSLYLLGEVSFLKGDIERVISKFNILFIRLGIKFDNKLLIKATNLKYIASPTTGLDHIDQNYCKKNNIQILSLKGESKFLDSVSSTAELTFGLIISLLRKINEATNNTKLGNWQRSLFKGFDLKGKTLGRLLEWVE